MGEWQLTEKKTQTVNRYKQTLDWSSGECKLKIMRDHISPIGLTSILNFKDEGFMAG